MQKGLIAIGIIDYNRIKLFFTNYKALRKYNGFWKSLRLSAIHTQDSMMVTEAMFGIDYGEQDRSVFTQMDLSTEVTITATFEPDSAFSGWIDEIFFNNVPRLLDEDHGDGGENG